MERKVFKKGFSFIGHKKKRRPTFLYGEMLQKTRDFTIGSCLVGTVAQKMVIAIGTGVIKTNEAKMLKEFS